MPSAAPAHYDLPPDPERLWLPQCPMRAPRDRPAVPKALALTARAAQLAAHQQGRTVAETVAPPPRGPHRGHFRTLALLVSGLALVGLSVVAWSRMQGQLAEAQAELRTTQQQLAETQTRQTQREADRARDVATALSSLRSQMHRDLDALSAQVAGAGQAQTHLQAVQHRLEARLAQAEATLRNMPPARPAENEPAQAAFKRAFARASRAVLYIRTTYRVRFAESGDEQELSASGTGFLVSPDGIAMTARHVLYPWRYDRKLVASQALGLLAVEPESVQVSIWLAGRQVTAGDGEDAPFLDDDAYRRDASHAQVHMLYVGSGARHHESVMTADGPAEVNMPGLGQGDVAVFQLVDPGRRFPYLQLAQHPKLRALDDVLVVGFPLARLLDGRAVPQGTEGHLRRAGGPMLELDAALHPGNSGGPVLGLDGRVVGMASAILDSPVYGLALPESALQAAWRATQTRALAGQSVPRGAPCPAGPAERPPDTHTLAPVACATRLPSGP